MPDSVTVLPLTLRFPVMLPFPPTLRLPVMLPLPPTLRFPPSQALPHCSVLDPKLETLFAAGRRCPALLTITRAVLFVTRLTSVAFVVPTVIGPGPVMVVCAHRSAPPAAPIATAASVCSSLRPCFHIASAVGL
jgi:hypothetical protein